MTDRADERAVADRGRYLDGAWHRLHPATPVLRGGIAFLAVLAVAANYFRDTVTNLVFRLGDDGDPLTALGRAGLLVPAALIVLAVVVVLTGAFYLSWRASAFRIADGSVTARQGVLLRTTRTARLDRIQGVTIGRPLLARLVGAARIELDVAGQNANVRLEYLSSGAAEALRHDVLELASGARRASADPGEEPAPLRDDRAPGVRLLTITPARAVGSVLLSESTVVIVVLVVVAAVAGAIGTGSGAAAAVVSVVPFVIGGVGVSLRRIGRNLRFTIEGTPDGVRIGAGLLSTSNEAVPPGRIHAVRIEQPLLWRPAGWWRVVVDRAGRIGGRRNNELERAVAPVARRDEVLALLPYLVPDLTDRLDLLSEGMVGRRRGEFVPAPPRAAWLRPLAWRRTGFALADGAMLMRGGFLRRHLVLVPQARVQSVALLQGPASRVLRVATVEVHTVQGPVRGRMELVDVTRAATLFGELAETGQHARDRDRAHRWAAERHLHPAAPRTGTAPGAWPAPAADSIPLPGPDPDAGAVPGAETRAGTA